MAPAKRNLLAFVFFLFGGGCLITFIASCGKGVGAASATGLNIEYNILNLSPDVFPVDLFIDFKQVNVNSFIYGSEQGYFYLPSTDTPYQVRSARFTGTNLFTRDDILKPGAKYTLYITGSGSNGTPDRLFTVDTATVPTLGRGKLRFVNVSPSAIGGLDVYANGTKAFGGITYLNYSPYIEIPVGNYDFQIDATGSTAILNETQSFTIQDGHLYTLYAYGYTSRADSAAFSSGITTNR